MVTAKEELVAAGIRKQISFLEGLLSEMETGVIRNRNIPLRIREVETELRELRSEL